jgi:uncharacterized protein
MTKIGLISDTHGFVEEKFFNFFKECDEIWHAGDIGNEETADQLEAFKPLRAVYGNIDGHQLRSRFKQINHFTKEDVSIVLTHIGGYPNHYEKSIIPILESIKPQLFICGHSHILRIIFDKKLNFLYMNPGAAGNSGFHQVKTALRFEIQGRQIQNLEILELKRNH